MSNLFGARIVALLALQHERSVWVQINYLLCSSLIPQSYIKTYNRHTQTYFVWPSKILILYTPCRTALAIISLLSCAIISFSSQFKPLSHFTVIVFSSLSPSHYFSLEFFNGYQLLMTCQIKFDFLLIILTSSCFSETSLRIS